MGHKMRFFVQEQFIAIDSHYDLQEKQDTTSIIFLY